MAATPRYPVSTTFTVTVGRTAIYIALAAALFLASFSIAANAQSIICSTGPSGCYIAATTNGSVVYPAYQVATPAAKDNQYLWVWKWLAMFGTFGGGVFFSVKAFESFRQ